MSPMPLEIEMTFFSPPHLTNGRNVVIVLRVSRTFTLMLLWVSSITVWISLSLRNILALRRLEFGSNSYAYKS